MLHGKTDGRIRFGPYIFSEPQLLPQARTFQSIVLPGVYVVLVFDAFWGPRPFRPLYFGESGDLWSRTTAAHEKSGSWRLHAGMFALLYRAFCPLPGSTQSQRQAAESALVAQYNPPCNERLSVSLASLLGS